MNEDSRLLILQKCQLIHTSTGDRGFEIKYSCKKNLNCFIHLLANKYSRLRTHAKKIPIDSDINWRTRIPDYVVQKITIDSYMNLRTRIPDYVFTKNFQLFYTTAVEQQFEITYSPKSLRRFILQLVKEDSRLCTYANNPSWFIHQMVNEDSRLRIHQKSQLIHTSNGEWGSEITYKPKIPVDSYIKWCMRIRDYVFTKNPSWFIHKLANEDSRLYTHAKNPKRFIYQLVIEYSGLRTHEINPNLFLHQVANEDCRLSSHAKKSQLNHTTTGLRGLEITYSHGKYQFIHTSNGVEDPQIAQSILINGLTEIRGNYMQNFIRFIHQLLN